MKPGETQLPAVANDNAWRVDSRYRYPWRPAGDDTDLVVSYETRLARARREATLMGWRLERSKARNQCAPGHGLYRMVDATSGDYVAGGEPYPFSLLLEDAEALLWGSHHPYVRGVGSDRNRTR
jgi:hypothetical protein